MKPQKTVEIASAAGDLITIPLTLEDDREVAILMIDDVQYHFERITKDRLISEYRVDDDPHYQPQTDAEGYCYILAPFSK